MKTLLWISIGSAIAGGVLLLVERTGEGGSPAATKTYGETTRVALAVPAGWRRFSGSDPELSAQATALASSSGFASLPYGTLKPFTSSDGKTYATWIEQHYHKPGGPAKPWGLHHGVTVLARDTFMV